RGDGLTEHLINCAARAPNCLGNGCRAVSLLVQLDDFGMVERHGPALVNTLAFSRLDSGTLSLPDKPDLHLGDHPQHRQDHLADQALGRDLGLQDPEVRTFALELMHQVQDIACATAEAVEFDHDQGIAGANEVQDGGQCGAALTLSPRGALAPNDLAQHASLRRATYTA